MGLAEVLGPLTSGQDLTSDQARAAMAEILAGEGTPTRIAGFIVALRMKGETVEELCGLVQALLEVAERVPVDPAGLVDTCGTGGDRSGSINVSTIAALVVAGAGAGVCKHGNRAASSVCGSADLLEELGVAVDLGPAGVAQCLSEAGIAFCLAPRFHPAMRHAAPIRRELGVPTVFNFIGPLANPARVRRQVVGVSDGNMAHRMLEVLQTTGAERAMVVYGHDGLDELTTTTTSTVLELRDGDVRTYLVDPEELDLPLSEGPALAGGDAATNAGCARRVLEGETGPHRDLVLLNAAAGLVVAGVADDLMEGLERARSSVDEGGAAAALDGLVTASQKAKAAEL